MKYPIAIVLSILFDLSHLASQSSLNPNDAVPICGHGNYNIGLPKTNFSDLSEFNCFPQDAVFDNYELLLIHHIIKAGTINIDFSPSGEDDIDFIVFKVDGRSVSPIRCMASGKNFGEKGASCLGVTGLSEGSSDEVEFEGCDGGNDNYVKNIDAEVGDKYLILVTNYKSGSPTQMHMYGTAEFDIPTVELKDSLLFCKGYSATIKLKTDPNIIYAWESSNTEDGNFQAVNNLFGSRFVIPTDSTGSTYYRVKSTLANQSCKEVTSNLIKVDVKLCPNCMDEIKNGSETDVDCGGEECPQCQGCDLITNIVLADTIVNCEGNWTDTIPIVANYCNVVYDGVFSMDIVGDECFKTITKRWTFELPDSVAIISQVITVDRKPNIINFDKTKNSHVQCDFDVPNVPSLYYLDKCSGDTIYPTSFMEKLVVENNLPPIVKRRWSFPTACADSLIIAQEILIQYTQGIKIPDAPENLKISCEVKTPEAPLLEVIVDCDTKIQAKYTEEESGDACARIFTRNYTFKLPDGIDTVVSYTITKIDSIAPVPSLLPENVSFICLQDTSKAPNITALDNCTPGNIVPIFEMTNNGGLGTEESPLVFDRTWTFKDACGNEAIVKQTMTIQNSSQIILPESPKNVQVTCLSEVPEIPILTATAGCGVFINGEFKETRQGNSCEMTIERLWTFSYLDLQTKTISQTIKVINKTVPEFIAPADTIIECGTNVEASTLGTPSAVIISCGNTADIFSTDVFGEDFSCPGSGLITRSWHVKDLCDNETVKVQKITSKDTKAPELQGPFEDLMVSCLVEIPKTVTLFGKDMCTGEDVLVKLTETNNGGQAIPSDHYILKRKRALTDACGNSREYLQTITVVGSTAVTYPEPPAAYTVSCIGEVGEMEGLIATNGCDNVAEGVKKEERTGDSCTTEIVRSWSFSFADIPTKTITQIIKVQNRKSPEFEVPANITLSCDVDQNLEILGEPAQISTYCDIGTSSSFVDGAINEICKGNGSKVRTWKVTDVCGNTATKQQIITTKDTEAPVVQHIPQDVFVKCKNEIPLPTIGEVIADDNCSKAFISVLSDVVSDQICANKFRITRTYVATDACGNSSTQDQTIKVEDDISPIITSLPSDRLVSCENNVPNVNTNGVVATDNCGSITVYALADEISNEICENQYTITRTYVVEDACGNTSSESQTIQVNDQIGPIISSIPNNLTVGCSGDVPVENTGAVIATDNCGSSPEITVLGDVITNQSCENRYTITRTYIATDACGNTTSRSQEITVNDRTGPNIISIPQNVEVSCEGDTPATEIEEVISEDNCGESVSISVLPDIISNKICLNKYTITRTYVSTDVCGNSSTKNQTIVVNDNESPTITYIPEDETVSCVDEVPASEIQSVTSFDNCEGVISITVGTDVITNKLCANQYQITRTYRATDICGNTSTENQIITVKDETSPTISSIPADATVNCSGNVPVGNTSLVSAYDNCNENPVITVLTDVISNKSCLNKYEITRTYVATDACGNSEAQSQTIIVDDNISPTISVIPSDRVVSCENNVPNVNTNGVVATDNCGSITVNALADEISNEICENQYTITRTYVVEDACGNTSSESQTIQVNDQIGPIISSIPNNLTVGCSGDVPVENTGAVIATDNCGSSPEITVLGDVITNQSCENRYTITRTYVATDACGNTTSRSQEITVNDRTGPNIISIPQNIEISCEGDTPATEIEEVISEDNCGEAVSISVLPDIISNKICLNKYTITRTYVSTDVCGNSSTKNQTIVVNDNESPTITYIPEDETVSCVDEVPTSEIQSVSSFDNCEGVISITVGTDVIINKLCANQYQITRTYRATDICGNTSTENQIITVKDETSPTISSIPADAIVNCSGNVPVGNTSLVSAYDNCNENPVITVLTDVISNKSCLNKYEITRTYVATDACGNSEAQSQTIIVDDDISPTISVIPSDRVVSCENNVPNVNTNGVAATDNCGSITVYALADEISNEICENQYTITRTYVVEDACGNTSSESQTIQVNDQIGPIISSIPNNLTIGCSDDVPVENTGAVIATDNCGSSPEITVLGDVITNQSCENRYTITRTYIATDACGNTTSRSQEITVNDRTGPNIISIPQNVEVSCEGDTPATEIEEVISEDNCGESVSISVLPDIISNKICLNKYTITRTYVSTDVCGNSSTKNQTIVVNDNESPTITYIPEDETVSCVDEVPTSEIQSVSSFDNCEGGISITVGTDVITNKLCANQYQITRTYRATDICGNTSTENQIITVKDETSPTISSFPADVVVNCSGNVPVGNTSLVSAYDNCKENPLITVLADVISNKSCPNKYEITRTYVATDACGNSEAQSQTIIVDDDISPTISVIPSDRVVSCENNVPNVNTNGVAATDNCGSITVYALADEISNEICENQYTITRTYVVEDACGNTSSESQTIQVNDQIGPIISSIPNNLTVGCSGDVPVENTGAVIATDNCGSSPEITVLGDVITNQSCENRYTIKRTYVATDACGNTTSRSQEITVNDRTGPNIISIPQNIEISCEGDTPATEIEEVISEDNCGEEVSISVLPDIISNKICLNKYTITRTYVSTDVCGNSSTKNQTIVVNDKESPTITYIPDNVTVSCVDEVPTSEIQSVSSFDNCEGGISITVGTDVISNKLCANQYQITRTYRATDICGNTSTENQIITVKDETSPTISSFPADATVNCSGNVPVGNTSLVSAYDNCNENPIITVLTDVISNKSCPNKYEITRTYVATDACGNSEAQSQTIIVDDNISPTISVIPSDKVVSCENNVPNVNTNGVVATDNCGSITVYALADEISNEICANQYTITRTYVVEDACGNTSSENQTIQVNDQIGPIISSIPNNLTVGCSDDVPVENTGAVIATDNCGSSPEITVLGDVITNQSCENRYTITRTYIATDACGNTTSRSQEITVNDRTGPNIISIPQNVEVSCEGDTPATEIEEVISEDNCGESVSISVLPDIISNKICLNKYTITRTYVSTDVCGNSSTKNQTIVVNDKESPTITYIPDNVTVSCVDEVPTSEIQSVSSFDNCEGGISITVGTDVITNKLCANQYQITRTYRATDICGNTSTENQIITVKDETSPTISSFPADVVVNCSGNVPVGNTSLVSAYDNCNENPIITVLTDVISNKSCPNKYEITRTYVATDACGNSEAQSQTIIVDDNETPVFASFPADVTVGCPGNVPNSNIGLISASDNCGSVNKTVLSDIKYNEICPNNYTISRTYIVSDVCGNTDSRTQNIYVQDVTGPNISFRITPPRNIFLNKKSLINLESYYGAGASDSCPGNVSLSISESDNGEIGCSSNPYVLNRSWRAIDVCGNLSIYDQTITVVDNVPPSFIVPSNINADCDIEIPSAVSLDELSATDESGVQSFSYRDVKTTGEGNALSPLVYKRYYTVTDICNNSIEASPQNISLIDYTPGTISILNGGLSNCPNSTRTLSASGGINFVWNTGSHSSTINVAPYTTTRYSVAVTNNFGCKTDASINVLVSTAQIQIDYSSGNSCISGVYANAYMDEVSSFNWVIPGILNTTTSDGYFDLSPYVGYSGGFVTGTNTSGCSSSINLSVPLSTACCIPPKVCFDKSIDRNTLYLRAAGTCGGQSLREEDIRIGKKRNAGSSSYYNISFTSSGGITGSANGSQIDISGVPNGQTIYLTICWPDKPSCCSTITLTK